MSAKRWKRARSNPKSYARDIDREKRRVLRPPWWIRLLTWAGYERIPARWRTRWERHHDQALHDSVKIMTHGIMRGKK